MFDKDTTQLLLCAYYMKFYYEIYHNADGFIKLFILLKTIIYI